MSDVIPISRTATLPLSLTVTKDDVGGVTSLTPTVAVRRTDNGQYLDWFDLTFKSSGWTAKTQLLTDVGGGNYQTFLVLTPLALAAGITLSAEYVLLGTPGLEGTCADLFYLSADSTSLDDIHKATINKSTMQAGVLTVYKDDDTTVLYTAAITDYQGHAVVDSIGLAARRAKAVFT